MFTQQYIMELFTTYVDTGLKFVRKSCIQGIDQVQQIIISYHSNWLSFC